MLLRKLLGIDRYFDRKSEDDEDSPLILNETLQNKNLSNVCYNFIESNPDYFDLKKPEYSKNHSIAIEKLEKYSRDQICGNKFFELMLKMYNESNYIGPDEFLEGYVSSIEMLNEMDTNIVFILPLDGNDLNMNKSNFYFSLYFMHLYKKMTGKKLDYVYHMITGNISKKTDSNRHVNFDEILNELSPSKKETMFVFCDDFSYSGTQIVQFIQNLEIKQEINLLLVISGLTEAAKKLISQDEEIKKKKINVFLPPKMFIESFNNTFDNILGSIIDTNNKYKKKTTTDYMVWINYKKEWIRMNDMYVIKKSNKNLYAVGQMGKLGLGTQYMVYPFFKYPDSVSIIQRMCEIDDYSKTYTFLFDKLTKEQKRSVDFSVGTPPTFKITDKLIKEPDLNFLIDNFESETKIDTYIEQNVNLKKIIQKCSSDVHLINLTQCDDDKIKSLNSLSDVDRDSASSNICNKYCWTPFYKTITEEPPFKKLRETLERILKEKRSPRSEKRSPRSPRSEKRSPRSEKRSPRSEKRSPRSPRSEKRSPRSPRSEFSQEQYAKAIDKNFTKTNGLIEKDTFLEDWHKIVLDSGWKNLYPKEIDEIFNEVNGEESKDTINTSDFSATLTKSGLSLKLKKLREGLNNIILTSNAGGKSKKNIRKQRR